MDFMYSMFYILFKDKIQVYNIGPASDIFITKETGAFALFEGGPPAFRIVSIVKDIEDVRKNCSNNK